MSRKKKKKQKQLMGKTQDQESLNGWNCSATDVTDSDDEDDYDIDDETDDLPVEPAPRPQLFQPHQEPQVWVQPSLEIPTLTQNHEPDTAHTEQPQPEPQPIIAEQAQPEPQPIVAEQPQPEPQQLEALEKSENEGNLANDIKERVADRLSKSKDDLFKLFTQPRKPQSELEEDIIKFGGLDDEPEQDEQGEEAVPSKPQQLLQELLQKLKSLRRPKQPNAEAPAQQSRRQASPQAGTPADITPAQQETVQMSPIMLYAHETYSWGYNECYYIGIQVLRNLSDLRRRLFSMWMWGKYSIPHFIRKQRRRIARVLDAITDSCLHPFRDITAKTSAMQVGVMRTFYQKQDGRLVDSVKVFFRYLYSLGKPINSIISFVLPILGCAILATVVLYFQQLSYALSVEYSGVQLGYIAREGDFYEAKNKVYARLINEEYAPLDDSRPTFRLVITDPENLISSDALANKIMTISKNEVAMADGIYIDGAFLGAVEDGSEFLFYIDSILDNYRTATAHERVQFVKKVGLQRGMYPLSSIRPVHEIKNALESNETLPQTHKVVKEETLETIAEKNNTTVDDIIKLNTSLLSRAEESNQKVPSIFEGEQILVNRVELSLGIQVIRREVYTEEIAFATEYKDDNKELENYVEVLSRGKKGEREIVADITYIDGEKVNETVIERNVIKEPVTEKKARGTLKPADFLPAGGGDVNASFIWPVAGGYISAGLYGYAGHSGMDIAAPSGTGIYAGRSGTVTYASNRNVWPYGRRVNIDHGGGVTSLYAHCSEVVVQAGQYVKQGQLIAKVGRTGNATGNHCHIEIKINGRIQNPANFINKG